MANAPLMPPNILFPAPVKGEGVGLVEVAEADALAELEMTVKAGAEQEDVGAFVRVTYTLL